MNPPSAGPGLARELARHAYALEASGYTVLPAQINGSELQEMRRAADEALAAAQRVLQAGGKLSQTGGTAYYWGSRCLYCWSEACVRLLEHETIHALAGALMGSYRLWDMGVSSARPVPAHEKEATTSWHRDFDGLVHGARVPGYLWFFLCLDDVTAENGATWVVPGSHHAASRFEPESKGVWTGDDLSAYPSRIQLTGRAGDLLVLNPTLLHTSGRNATSRPRTLINVAVCQGELQPLLDHWTVAGPGIQERASEKLRKLLGADLPARPATWEGLPEGWITATGAVGASAP